MKCRFCRNGLNQHERWNRTCEPCDDIRARIRKDDEPVRAMLAELDFDRQAWADCVPDSEEIRELDRITKGA